MSSPNLPLAKTPPKRRILIVDDHPLVRRGLISLIHTEPDLAVCAEAATRRAALDAIASGNLDLVIADLSIDDGHGLDLVQEIRSRHDLPVLVLTMHDEPVYARRAFRAGASGYVTKLELGETLLNAIRCVLDGKKFVNPKIGVRLDEP